jgi:Tfp pilus assembly protein PilP
VIAVTLVLVFGSPWALAQPPDAQTPPATVEAPVPPPTMPDTYAYSSEGRRDPFVSLVARGQDAPPGTARPDGVPGLLVDEIALKGILRGSGGFLAMIQAPDNRTYTLRTGDRLFDGSVKTVLVDRVVFLQEVNDPLSLAKQREVIRLLRPVEDAP